MTPLLFAQLGRMVSISSPSISGGGALLASAAVMIPLLILLLPRGERRLARAPLVLLALSLVFFAIEEVVQLFTPPEAPGGSMFYYVGMLVLFLSMGRSVFLLCIRSIAGRRVFANAPQILLELAQGFVYFLLFVLVLEQAGIEADNILTGSALITAALSFSLRDTLGNLMAGLALQAQPPFEEGDWIQFDEYAHHIGEVVEINWRATKVVTLDKVEVTVPNSQLAQFPVRNFTKPKRYSRRSLYVVTPYEVPTRRVHRIILESLQDSWGVLRDPAPSVVTNAFTERGVEHWVRLFTNEFDQRDRVDGGARDRIWYGLNRNGIAIPGPIRQVQLDDATPEAKKKREQENMVERREALANVDFLDQLPDSALDRLAAATRIRHYAEGELIIRQGDDGCELFIISSGEVVILVRGSSGVNVEVNRLGHMKFFGEMSCLTGARRSATVRAASDCVLFVVEHSAFAPILAEAPELAGHISEVLAARQAELKTHSAQMQPAAAYTQPDRTDKDLLYRIKDFFSI